MVETIEVRQLASNHWQTYTAIIIDVPIKKVWHILTDWNNLTMWSTTLIGIKGNIQNNGEVVISYLEGVKTYDTPHIFIYKELEEFGWSDTMEGNFRGLTDNHRFRVEQMSNTQTLFIQTDDFKGLGNSRMTAHNVPNITVEFFPTLNRALKNIAEE